MTQASYKKQQQATRMSLVVLAAVSLAGSASAFPSLFNRQRLFGGQRNPAQSIPLEQHHQLASNNDQLMLAAAAPSPFGQFNAQDSMIPTPQAAYFRPIASLEGPMQPAGIGFASNPLQSGSLEQSPSGEIVDKIERHIGQQIDQSLDSTSSGSSVDSSSSSAASAANSNNNNERQQTGEEQSGVGGDQRAASEYQRQDNAASSESAAASAGGGGGGGSESSEGDMKHHEEHPPEAFEVHHKKGGKSFQYFHQKHHQ